ncbi:MAG TPA: VOC family protein [Thermoanaerobaculia bacterium]|jgi:PhnB protein
MPQLDTYLVFDGNCAEAMRFYERTLGGKLETLMTHAESPVAAQTPPGSADRIMHARLVLDGRVLMASDAMAGPSYEGMKGFSLALVYPTVAEAKKVFDALAEGGEVRMPLEKTFWAESFGMLVDRFGTPWMVNGGRASS